MRYPNHLIGTELIDLRDGRPCVVSQASPMRVRKRNLATGGWHTLAWEAGRFRRAHARNYVLTEVGLKRKREAARRRRLRADEAKVRLLAAANRLTFEEAMEALA